MNLEGNTVNGMKVLSDERVSIPVQHGALNHKAGRIFPRPRFERTCCRAARQVFRLIPFLGRGCVQSRRLAHGVSRELEVSAPEHSAFRCELHRVPPRRIRLIGAFMSLSRM